jgi:membrane protein DedA with SNARE-associated domain
VVATIPRCLFLGYLGWGDRQNLSEHRQGIDRAESIVFGVIILAIIGAIIWLRARVRGENFR